MPVRHPTGSVTMGTAKKNVQRSHTPGSVPNAVGRVSASHDRGKLKLQPQNGTFFFRCIICVSTEKTAHTQIRTLARQHAPHRPPERKSERVRVRERAKERTVTLAMPVMRWKTPENLFLLSTQRSLTTLHSVSMILM